MRICCPSYTLVVSETLTFWAVYRVKSSSFRTDFSTRFIQIVAPDPVAALNPSAALPARFRE